METEAHMTASGLSMLQSEWRHRIEAILAQREEILAAFVAKYGFDPDRAVQIEEDTPEGKRWYVRRRTDAEVEAQVRGDFCYCAYCGEEFPVDDQTADVSEHIRTCIKHPMRKVEQERDTFQARVAAEQLANKMLGQSADLNARKVSALEGQLAEARAGELEQHMRDCPFGNGRGERVALAASGGGRQYVVR